MKKVLIANRGEIAIRIARGVAEAGLSAVAVFSQDDAASLHVALAEEAQPLPGTGAAAYLEAGRLIAIARECGCDAVHPGYGFLSEDAAFAPPFSTAVSSVASHPGCSPGFGVAHALTVDAGTGAGVPPANRAA